LTGFADVVYIERSTPVATLAVGGADGGVRVIQFVGSSGSKSDVARNMLAGGAARVLGVAPIPVGACVRIAGRFSLVGP
jgi:hypothetical protein